MRKRRIAAIVVLALLVAATSVAAARAGPGDMLRANAKGPPALQLADVGPIPDQVSLLNFPFPVEIQYLTGVERDMVLASLTAREEYLQLSDALRDKGFEVDDSLAEVMRVTMCRRLYLPVVMKGYELERAAISAPTGVSTLGAGQWADGPCTIDMMAVPAYDQGQPSTASQAEGLTAYLVAMDGDDGTSYFQAHHTNLDPALASVPHTPIEVNGMEYFYITTLHVIQGQIVVWHYWWYNSQHHPNWYYSYYRHYWDYYFHAGYYWPNWYHWAYGWYYWRFWYYWSTYFPWAETGAVPLGQE